jgi:retron-type reverse transcriptase
LNVIGNNFDNNNRGHVFGIALALRHFKLKMRTYKSLYPKIYNMKNLVLAYKKARKGKTKKLYVKEFEENLAYNLKVLHDELKNQNYNPEPLEIFILRDPKTRKISKSVFRDRIVHHALFKIIESIFDKTFIYDSCANRINKGNLFAIKRFETFMKKVSKNGKINGWFNNNQIKGYCLKLDIKHYFQEINHRVLINIIQKKIKDKKVIWLIKKILRNYKTRNMKQIGMPLGNLTSQFFANVYLNELDYFIKHKLKAKYYLRYVDDFVILYNSKLQLKIWKQEINDFLKKNLKLELHPDKSRIISLLKGIDFVGFRNFYYYKLLRNRNIKKMIMKIKSYKEGDIPKEKIIESFQGWQAYAKWANSFKLRKRIIQKI